MDHFSPRGGVLHAEDVPLPAIAEAVGTPAYVYSTATMVRHAEVMTEADIAQSIEEFATSSKLAIEAGVLLSLVAAVRLPDRPEHAFNAGALLLAGVDAPFTAGAAIRLDDVSATVGRLADLQVQFADRVDNGPQQRELAAGMQAVGRGDGEEADIAAVLRQQPGGLHRLRRHGAAAGDHHVGVRAGAAVPMRQTNGS